MDNKLLFTDLVQAVADKGFTRKDAEAFVRCFFQQVEKYVFAGESVKINGLGTFRLQKVEPRKSVNVHTGEQMEIEGHYKFSYLPDSGLKEAVNQPYAYLDNAEVDDNDTSETPLFTVYDPEVEAPAEKTPATMAETVAEDKAEDATEEAKKKTGKSVRRGKTPVIIVLCTLLAVGGAGYLFMHYTSCPIANTDSQQISTVVDNTMAEAVQADSEPVAIQAEPNVIQPETKPVKTEQVTMNTATEDPKNWETMKTVTVGHGGRLTIYALQNYGNKVFWVYIFLANRDVLKNPNSVSEGTVIRIPKAPESVINASDPASIAKARAIEAQLKASYD